MVVQADSKIAWVVIFLQAYAINLEVHGYFSTQMAKENEMSFLRCHNLWKYQVHNANYFLVNLQVLPFQKIIVAKTPQ